MSSLVFELNGSVSTGMIAAGERFNAALNDPQNINDNHRIDDFFLRCKNLGKHSGAALPVLDIFYQDRDAQNSPVRRVVMVNGVGKTTYSDGSTTKNLNVQPARDAPQGARTHVVIPRDIANLLDSQGYLSPIVNDIVNNILDADDRRRYLLATIMFRRCA